MNEPNSDTEKIAMISKWLKVYGIILFIICAVAAAYSIIRPNFSPLSPQEQEIMDAGHQQGSGRP